MKRLVPKIVGAMLALVLLAAGAARAQSDPGCVTQDIYCQYSYKSTDENPNPLVDLTSALMPPQIFAIGPHSPQPGQSDPFLGMINLDTFYLIVYDGNASNMDPMDGYLGISGRDLDHALLGIVFDRSGNFDRFHGDNTPLIQMATPRLVGRGIPYVLGHPGIPSGSPPSGTLPTFNIPALPGPIAIPTGPMIGGKLF